MLTGGRAEGIKCSDPSRAKQTAANRVWAMHVPHDVASFRFLRLRPLRSHRTVLCTLDLGGRACRVRCITRRDHEANIEGEQRVG